MTAKSLARALLLRTLPPLRKLVAERDSLLTRHEFVGFAPPGHFYSPIVSVEEIIRDKPQIFGPFPRVIPGIDLHEREQLDLLDLFESLYDSIPFTATKTDGARYYYENDAYSYSDAIFLHCMIRHLKPSRIVEVGSGFSSCVTLDTNEKFFENSIATTFIDPYPELLNSLLTRSDRERVTIIPKRLQDVDISVFSALQANDILFIDSTHVSKTNSDVNRAFFELLPSLAPGVHIHIHDVFYPFEYPESWVLEGRSWNELYLLRAFLQYNPSFKIVFMNTFLQHFHEARIRERMPLCFRNSGASIWLRKE